MSTKKTPITADLGVKSKTESNAVKLIDYDILVKSRYKYPSSDSLIQIAKDHLKFRKAKPGIVEIELINQARIHQINKTFREIDRPTDVLSFPAAEFPLPTSGQPEPTKLYGTIFLCCDIIKLNALQTNKSFEEEFDFILRHGLDHLLGIHHD
jgi:probable rRNA maturation factor